MFCLSFVDVLSPWLSIHNMYNTVHIRAKWFLTTPISGRVTVAPGEKVPNRLKKSRRFNTKDMSLDAVTIHDTNTR